MKPLVTQHRILTWICLCPFPEGITTCQKIKYISLVVFIVINAVNCILTSIAYYWKFMSIDLKESLFALFQIAASLSVIYQFIIALLSRQNIFAVIQGLEKIYDESKSDDTFKFLVETNEKCEWVWRFYFKFIICGFAVNTVTASTLSILFCMLFDGNFDAKYAYHPFRHRLPWNQQTELGYVGEIIFDLCGGGSFLFGNGTIMLLFISLCMHHQAFLKMFQHSLRKLEHHEENGNNEALLCKLIQFHISIKSWFLESAKVYSLIVVVILFCSMMMSACVVFQLELQFKHPDFDLIMIFTAIIVGVSTPFCYCFNGKLATESFGAMSDCLFEANWPDLPIKLQKYFVIMICDSQRIIYYHGFDVAILDLLTFTKLMKTVITYYMMFRTLVE